MKALIAMTTQNPDEGDIEHTMVAIPNTYRIDSQLKDKIASNLTVLLADIRESPDDITLPALEVLGKRSHEYTKKQYQIQSMD
jgi:hypothetical protein